MRSRLDREISRRLLQEVPTEPTVKNSRIDQLLYRVCAEDVQDNSKVVRAFPYRTAVAAVDETANKLTEDQAIEAAKQYVSKIYGIDTNQARAAVDVTTYEDSEDDEYNIVLKKKGWKYEYSVAVKINSGEINQSAISEGDKWISASDASYRKGIERKYLRTVQQMMDKIAPNQSIKSIYGISRFDKQNLLLYGEITYYVRSEDGVTYVIKYAPSDMCLTGVFVHKDFHELWQQMKREKKQDQKEGINTIIEKCY